GDIPNVVVENGQNIHSNMALIDKLFDGDIGREIANEPPYPVHHYQKTDATIYPMPFHFTIDLQKDYALTKIKFFQRTDGATAYSGGNVKRFRVWASSVPNPNGAFDSSWTELGE